MEDKENYRHRKQEEWLKVKLQLDLPTEGELEGWGALSAPSCSCLLVLHAPALFTTFWITPTTFVEGKKCSIILSKSDDPAWGKNVKRSQESELQEAVAGLVPAHWSRSLWPEYGPALTFFNQFKVTLLI